MAQQEQIFTISFA